MADGVNATASQSRGRSTTTPHSTEDGVRQALRRQWSQPSYERAVTSGAPPFDLRGHQDGVVQELELGCHTCSVPSPGRGGQIAQETAYPGTMFGDHRLSGVSGIGQLGGGVDEGAPAVPRSSAAFAEDVEDRKQAVARGLRAISIGRSDTLASVRCGRADIPPRARLWSRSARTASSWPLPSGRRWCPRRWLGYPGHKTTRQRRQECAGGEACSSCATATGITHINTVYCRQVGRIAADLALCP